MPAILITSESVFIPLKSLLVFKMIYFTACSFLDVYFFPATLPNCFPFSFAVLIPSAFLWCKSCTSFSACSKAILICSFASTSKYSLIAFKRLSALVPVLCTDYIFVSLCVDVWLFQKYKVDSKSKEFFIEFKSLIRIS